jgi:hypothetical protein
VIKPKVEITFININPNLNNGFNKEINFNVPLFELSAVKEDRGIKSVRFIVSIYDSFNDLLYKTGNFDHSFNKPISIDEPILSDKFIAMEFRLSKVLTYALQYNSYSQNETVQNLEYIRLNKNNIKIKTETLAIEFSDGSIRK